MLRAAGYGIATVVRRRLTESEPVRGADEITFEGELVDARNRLVEKAELVFKCGTRQAGTLRRRSSRTARRRRTTCEKWRRSGGPRSGSPRETLPVGQGDDQTRASAPVPDIAAL